MEFTNKYIVDLLPRTTPWREWENAGDPGFHIQISPRGTRTFYLFYRHGGDRRFLNLGRHPQTSVAAARRKARQAKLLIAEGLDPQEYRLAELQRRRRLRHDPERERWERERKGSVPQLFDSYCRSLAAAGKRGHAEARRTLQRDAIPILGEFTKANTVQPEDIQAVLRPVVDRGAPVQANRLRAWLSAAFRFGIRHDNDPANAEGSLRFFLESNPVRDVPQPMEHEQPGDRELSATQIHRLWHGLLASELAKPTQIALKLILATAGQKSGDILAAQWRDFDLHYGLWEIPAARPGACVVPITGTTELLLRELRQYSGDHLALFPVRGPGEKTMPPASLSRAVARYCARTGFERFTPRDLRRTAMTHMRDIGINARMRDHIQGRGSRSLRAGREETPYADLSATLSAMKTWDGHLQAIVSGRAHDALETAGGIFEIPER